MIDDRSAVVKYRTLWLLEQSLEQLDQSGEEEAAIYVNNAIEIIRRGFPNKSHHD